MLLAGMLGATGQQVLLVTRTDEQADAIRSGGLRLMEVDGNEAQTVETDAAGFEAYSTIINKGSPPDWILLAVKQKDIGSTLLAAIRARMGPNTRLCCLQNGLGHLEQLDQVAKGRLFAAVTTEGARRTGQSQVLHTGRGITRIGAVQQGRAPEDKKHEEWGGGLAALLNEAGLPAVVSNSIYQDAWEKLIINSVINPVTAILEVANGELLNSPDALTLMEDLYREAVQLACSSEVHIGSGLWERLLGVCMATARNESSMLQDIKAGRETELEWITGYLLKKAAEANLKLPSHEAIYRLVKAKSGYNIASCKGAGIYSAGE